MLARFHHGASALSVAFVLFAASPAHAASWQSNVNYGGSTRMDMYVPDNKATPAPVLVSLHYCGGTGPNARSWFQSYSDQYGFILIAPTAGGNCFDATASRAGERAAIAAMVDYLVKQNGADPQRVFAAGLSSGACMAHALAAAYPDVFAGASSLAGVPAGAWTGGNAYGWSTSGVSGAQAWGDKARNAAPGQTGPWPRMQIWHGEADTNLTYSNNYPAEVQQWTNVHALTDADGMQANIQPSGASNTWNRTSYKKNGILLVEANHAGGVDHDLGGKGLWRDVIRFFELDKSKADTTYGKGGGTGGAGGAGSGGQSAGGAAGTGTSAGGAPGGAPGAGGMSTSAGGANSSGGPGLAGATTGGRAATAGSGGTGGSSSGATGVAGTTTTAAGTGGTGAPAGTGGTAPSAGRSGTVPGGAGTGPGAGPDSSTDEPAADTGCGCRVGPSRGGTESSALAAIGLGLLGLVVRRRRSAARR